MVSEKQEQILDEVRSGACVPRLSTLSKNLNIPTSTIKYNIEQLEDSGAILGYTAVTDPAELGYDYEGYTLINLTDDAYADPETVASNLASHEDIDTVAIITGEYELLLRVKATSMNNYFDMLKNIMDNNPIRDVKTISCLTVIKQDGTRRPSKS